MPNFIEMGPMVWISITDIYAHTHTHIDFYILEDRFSPKRRLLLETSNQRFLHQLIFVDVGWFKQNSSALKLK
jgi:hypothetical protein